MGTRFELVLPAGEPERAVGEAALEEIAGCHARFSRFDQASLLTHILRAGPERPVPLDAGSYALFEDAIAVWRDSAGAFDPTVPHRDMDAIALDPDTRHIRLTRPIPKLDLGAVAKGHALDLAARTLRDHGVTSAFLHGGTSSAFGIGAPPGADAWRVALAGGGEVWLRDRALSVSAVWEGNPHPTLDPRTGVAVPGPRRTAVTGPSARLADAWSTATLVLGQRPPSLSAEWELTITDG
jgi:thiamine biosynthesis lipoprotein